MAPTKKYKDDYKTIVGQDLDVESEKTSEDSRTSSTVTSVANDPFVAYTASVTRHVRILVALVVLMGVASIGHLYVKVGRPIGSGSPRLSFPCKTNEDCENQFICSPVGDAGTTCETRFGRCYTFLPNPFVPYCDTSC